VVSNSKQAVGEFCSETQFAAGKASSIKVRKAASGCGAASGGLSRKRKAITPRLREKKQRKDIPSR